MTLPATDDFFFHLLRLWFPRTYDVKALVRSADPALKGGLEEFAENLGVRPSIHSKARRVSNCANSSSSNAWHLRTWPAQTRS
jgi:hypothetical protein